MEFAADGRIRAIQSLIDAFLKNVLWDEEPLFISDEANIFDVSMASPQELAKRCAEYYKTSVTVADLRKPLWQLLPELERQRVSR
jgi:hypothetical protein